MSKLCWLLYHNIRDVVGCNAQCLELVVGEVRMPADHTVGRGVVLAQMPAFWYMPTWGPEMGLSLRPPL